MALSRREVGRHGCAGCRRQNDQDGDSPREHQNSGPADTLPSLASSRMASIEKLPETGTSPAPECPSKDQLTVALSRISTLTVTSNGLGPGESSRMSGRLVVKTGFS